MGPKKLSFQLTGCLSFNKKYLLKCHTTAFLNNNHDDANFEEKAFQIFFPTIFRFWVKK